MADSTGTTGVIGNTTEVAQIEATTPVEESREEVKDMTTEESKEEVTDVTTEAKDVRPEEESIEVEESKKVDPVCVAPVEESADTASGHPEDMTPAEPKDDATSAESTSMQTNDVTEPVEESMRCDDSKDEVANDAMDEQIGEETTREEGVDVAMPDVEKAAEDKTEGNAPIVTDFSTAPKRPTCAFFLFAGAMRSTILEELKQKNGKASSSDVSKETSERWAVATLAERKVYDDKHAALKARYEAYLEASDPLVALRTKYQDLIPKKPQSACFVFQHEARGKAVQLLEAEGKPVQSRNITAKTQEMWKNASMEEKAQVQERVLKLQIEFLAKQTAWQATPEFEELQQAERVHEAGKRSALQVKPKKSVKVAPKTKAKAVAKKAGKDVKHPSKGAPSTPSKRTKGATVSTPVSEAKKSRTSGGKATGPHIDEKVLVKARKLGLEEALKNLAARPEVMSSGKSTQKILDALEAKGGLVNPAKHALLGR